MSNKHPFFFNLIFKYATIIAIMGAYMDNLYMTISTDSKEVKFEFSKVEFINIK